MACGFFYLRNRLSSQLKLSLVLVLTMHAVFHFFYEIWITDCNDESLR